MRLENTKIDFLVNFTDSNLNVGVVAENHPQQIVQTLLYHLCLELIGVHSVCPSKMFYESLDGSFRK